MSESVELVEVVMVTNLFRASRMNGYLIPDVNEVVGLDADSADRLVASKHAKFVSEPEVAEGDAEVAGDAGEAEVKKPGRPRKVTV